MNYAPTPRWVKFGAGALAALVAAIGVLLLTGHGPSRHFHGANVFPPATFATARS